MHLRTSESFPPELAEQPFQRQLFDSSPLRLKSYEALGVERRLHGEVVELLWLQQLATSTASRRHQSGQALPISNQTQLLLTRRNNEQSPPHSPSISYRAEEEALIFELGTRHLSVGFTGESYPRCKLGFGPEESRRIGDYRRWLPGYDEQPRRRQPVETWGNGYELWQMDVRGSDLGIIEDKIERAVREAFTKYLLLDSKSRRLLVILPSIMPHQLLSTVLNTLFNNFQPPSITLLSPPILSTVAAGCRSGLVVDIGWRETIITSVYDYREVAQVRTTRAMRMLTLEMAKLLERYDKGTTNEKSIATTKSPRLVQTAEDESPVSLNVGLDQAEEVTTRMAWCKSRNNTSGTSTPEDTSDRGRLEPINEDQPNDSISATENTEDPLVSLPSPSSPRHSISIPFSQLAQPVETALLATSKRRHDLDDHEQPLHTLIYKSLLSLPPDVRSVCMSRIIFTGGGSNIPGLKSRLLSELSAIVQERGWDVVEGKAADERRRRLKEISSNRRQQATSTAGDNLKEPSAAKLASIIPQDANFVDEKLHREREKESKPTVLGVIRSVETLGAWAGGSLLANLRIRGVVEIDKDSFLQHGLAGARKEAETNIAQQKGFGAGMARGGMADRSAWTLGAWA